MLTTKRISTTIAQSTIEMVTNQTTTLKETASTQTLYMQTSRVTTAERLPMTPHRLTSSNPITTTIKPPTTNRVGTTNVPSTIAMVTNKTSIEIEITRRHTTVEATSKVQITRVTIFHPPQTQQP